MAIKIVKGGFKVVPEGDQLLTVTKVELVPKGRPIQVNFEYVNADGIVLKERLQFTNEVAVDILGKRCDIALGGAVEAGTSIEENQLPDMFMGKTFLALIKHNEGKKGGTFANISYFKELVDNGEGDDDDL